MKTNEIFYLEIIGNNTEIFIRNENSKTSFELLAKGYWYEDHMLDYWNKQYPVVSFTWQNDNKIYIDIAI